MADTHPYDQDLGLATEQLPLHEVTVAAEDFLRKSGCTDAVDLAMNVGVGLIADG